MGDGRSQMEDLFSDLQSSIFYLLHRRHAKMNHRMLLPLLLQPLHGQPLEQFLLSTEIGGKRRYKQRLAEPARTAQKVVFARLHKAVKHLGLVDVDHLVVAHIGEVLLAYGIN